MEVSSSWSPTGNDCGKSVQSNLSSLLGNEKASECNIQIGDRLRFGRGYKRCASDFSSATCINAFPLWHTGSKISLSIGLPVESVTFYEKLLMLAFKPKESF